jgi:hypothetical protein
MARRIREAGLRVRFEPEARIAHANFTSSSLWLGQRFLAGQVIAATRSRDWSGPRRAAFIAATPLVPGILLRRNAPGILGSLRGDRRKWNVLATMVAGYMMQAAGEMAGYIAGVSERDIRRFDEYEVRLLDFAGLTSGDQITGERHAGIFEGKK